MTAGGTFFNHEGITGITYRDDNHHYDRFLMNETSHGEFKQTPNVYIASRNLTAMIQSISNRIYTLPNGVEYTSNVGNLGLGPSETTNVPSILEQIRDYGDIDYLAFGLHLGSFPLDLPGSLILGGYDRSRALGMVGKFPLNYAFLMDVYIGTESGYSPFNVSGNISVYQGLDGDPPAQKYTRNLNGPKRAAVAEFDARFPYIFLPNGTCEAAAESLPVVWNASIGLYLWDVNDPRYKSTVSSPAYLGFVFADKEDVDITIKVPFQLLNLTLLPPITEIPTPYFPCKPTESSWPGVFKLGRAFLQAAFSKSAPLQTPAIPMMIIEHQTRSATLIAGDISTKTTLILNVVVFVSYEKNISFVAQAPGPDTRQSIFVTPEIDAENIESDPIELFASTWAPYWREIQAPENSGGSSSPETAQEPEQGLTTGAKAGIAVGCVVAGLGGLVGAVFWTRRRKSRTAVQAESAEKSPPPREEALGRPRSELPANAKPGEIGLVLPHDIAGPLPGAQAPENPLYHELPTEAK